MSETEAVVVGVILLIGVCGFLLWGAFHLVAHAVSDDYRRWFDQGWEEMQERGRQAAAQKAEEERIKKQTEKLAKEAPEKIRLLEARIAEMEKANPPALETNPTP